MDAFNLLKADHRKVEQLFNELESANGKAKLGVFNQIKTELELHAHIEEKFFYPALEEPEETHELTLEAYEEHDVVKKLLRQLGRAKTANAEWEAQAKELRENVEHHVQEEENELFKKANTALGQEEIAELGEQMQAEKERRQRTAAKKGSGAKKSAGTKKTAAKTSARSTAAKRTSGSKSSKKGGSKKSSKSSGTKRSKSKKSSKKR